MKTYLKPGCLAEIITPKIFDTEKASEAFFRAVHDGEARCPYCGGLLSEANEARFWQNQQTYCAGCGRKFFATTGRRKLAFSIGEVFAIAWLAQLGFSNTQIAERLGRARHSIGRLRAAIGAPLSQPGNRGVHE